MLFHAQDLYDMIDSAQLWTMWGLYVSTITWGSFMLTQ